jgi:hypothetical protein
VTRADRDALSRPAALAYWGTVIVGLVLFTTTRVDEAGTVLTLWIGALGGTMLGQYFALRDVRFWVVAVVLVASGLYCAPLIPTGVEGATLWQAFIPALLCGYWSLGDRASIAACWFPAVIWMLSILDRSDGQLVGDGVGAALLAGFALAFLVILRGREARRVALWQRFAAVPLAEVQAAELLREPPARQLARATWGVTVGAISVALTLWLAPRLWHLEDVTGGRARVAERGAGLGGLPCCPVDEDAEPARVKEYFDLGRGHGAKAKPRPGLACQRCEAPSEAYAAADVPVDPFVTGADPGAVDVAAAVRAGEAERGEGPPAPTPSRVAPRAVASGGSAPPLATTTAATDAPALPTTRSTEAARQLIPPPPPAPPPVAHASQAPTRAAVADARRSPMPWLMTIGLGVLVFQVVALGLRPLRRLVTLRHLRRPFWDETVAQRVSNSWQLALIGLRDAGWQPARAEPPHALARRVGVAELERCATILERARHGLGLDAEDLAAMRRSADATYAAARAPLSPWARAIGWIRWPLA